MTAPWVQILYLELCYIRACEEALALDRAVNIGYSSDRRFSSKGLEIAMLPRDIHYPYEPFTTDERKRSEHVFQTKSKIPSQIKLSRQLGLLFIVVSHPKLLMDTCTQTSTLCLHAMPIRRRSLMYLQSRCKLALSSYHLQ